MKKTPGPRGNSLRSAHISRHDTFKVTYIPARHRTCAHTSRADRVRAVAAYRVCVAFCRLSALLVRIGHKRRSIDPHNCPLSVDNERSACTSCVEFIINTHNSTTYVDSADVNARIPRIECRTTYAGHYLSADTGAYIIWKGSKQRLLFWNRLYADDDVHSINALMLITHFLMRVHHLGRFAKRCIACTA